MTKISIIVKKKLKNFISNIYQNKLLLQIDSKDQYEHKYFGSGYGGSFIPDKILNKQSICYSVGAGEDVTFDFELIKNYECKVYSFDPTPKSIKHVKMLLNNVEIGKKTRINNEKGVFYDIDKSKKKNFSFQPIGIWKENKKMKFYSPRKTEYVSHSLINIEKTMSYFEAECQTVKSIMNELGHKRISLLKIDAIGAEYEIINSIINDNVKPIILIVSFCEGLYPIDRKYYNRIKKTLKKIKKHGYDVTYVNKWEVTFVYSNL